MHINGERPEGVYIAEAFIPRGKDSGYLFKAQAVSDYTDFEAICPLPNPPTIRKRGEGPVKDLNDPKYKEKIQEFLTHRFNWMVIKSLEATPGLTWETIKPEDPTTWGNYLDELKAGHFIDTEVAKILEIVTTANGLNQGAIDQAYKRFLAGKEEEPES